MARRVRCLDRLQVLDRVMDRVQGSLQHTRVLTA